MLQRAIGTGLAVVLACCAPADAADKLRVGKAVAHVFMFSTVDVGVAAGIFRKHDIDVEIVGFGGGARLHQGMAADAIDIGVGSGPDMVFAAKGSPELAVAAIANRPTAIGIAVPYHSSIKTFDDLKGRKIGVTSVGAVTYWLVLELARVKGWGPGGITPVTLGGTVRASIAAYKTGLVDATTESAGTAFQMEETKDGRWLGSTDSYVKELPNHVIYASTRMMKDRPELLRRFLAAYLETVSFMKKNRERTIRYVLPITGNSQHVQEREYDLVTPYLSETGRFSAGALATIARSSVEMKILDREPDMSKLYTEEFLPKN